MFKLCFFRALKIDDSMRTARKTANDYLQQTQVSLKATQIIRI